MAATKHGLLVSNGKLPCIAVKYVLRENYQEGRKIPGNATCEKVQITKLASKHYLVGGNYQHRRNL